MAADDLIFSHTDKPAPPESLKVSDVFADNCKLKWEPPADDGGGEIISRFTSALTSDLPC